MPNVLPLRRITPQTHPASTETPVVDIAALAKQISVIQRTQESMLEVQNDQDTRLEQLSLSVNSFTTLVYPTQTQITTATYSGQYSPMALIYPAPTISLEYPIRPEIRFIGASQLTETMLLQDSSPDGSEFTEEIAMAQVADGVPIEKLLERGGSLMFLISLTSCVVWLSGDIALIHPAASVIGLLVSPCLYLMGMAARKQIAS
jgi:hypothetical protein